MCFGIDANVLGLLYATDAAITVMKEQQSGHIDNHASHAGRKTGQLRDEYSGTKFAVNANSEALRQQLQEDNIRITMIEPGGVATELTNHITDEEAKEGLSGMIAAMEPLQSEDVANAIAYVVTQPERVSINEVLIRPTHQPN